MTVVGALATIIYVTTILTVVLGLSAYALYKVREKRRLLPQKSRVLLTYFVEYALPGMPAGSLVTVRAPKTTSWRVPLSLGAGIGLVVAVVLGIWLRLHGASSLDVAAEPRTMPDLKSLAHGAPSLFPYPSLDANGDGIIQDDERLQIHAEVPQFVLLSCDDNGAVAGLEWLRATMASHHAGGKVTYFMTGNYMEGRANYMGGPVDDWWQLEATESYVGLHGTTHAEGGQGWNVDRWKEELSGVHQQMIRKLAPPPQWVWDGYPWGSRAPFLVVDDAYFTALDGLRPHVVYDASLIVQPNKRPAKASEPRDVIWPFTLEQPLLDEVYASGGESTPRMKIGHHGLWEVPVYAWLLKGNWQPSLDYNLFKVYPCDDKDGRKDAVRDVMDNLHAHMQGNRAPFHVGFHAQDFTADKTCERATVARLMGELDKLVRDGANIRTIAMPELLEWMEHHGHGKDEAPPQ